MAGSGSVKALATTHNNIIVVLSCATVSDATITNMKHQKSISKLLFAGHMLITPQTFV